MLIYFLKQWFTTPFNDLSKLQFRVWLILSLLVTLIYGIQTIQPVFSHEYVVQDDARQHVFWALRFLDSELFSNDLIADYYQSNAPWGYASLYGLLAKIGIHPIWVSNFFPLVLGLVATIYGFGVVLQTFPVPVAGFIAMVLLNQMIWESPILAGATPRSFTYPLFLMFLYYLLRRNWLPYLIAIVLQGLFYPPVALIGAGILIVRLLRWKRGLLYPALEKNNLLFCIIGLGTIFLLLLLHALSHSQFGPIITLAEAQKLPEFYPPEGRVYFFQNNFWDFWSNGQRSGIGLLNNFNAPIIYTALFVPVAFFFPSRFPLVKRITSDAVIFIQIIVVSLGLFFLAHAVLFKLYLPSRYSMGLFLVTRLLAGIGVTLILDAILNICEQSKKVNLRMIAIFLSLYLGTILSYWLFFFYPNQKKVFIVLLILGFGIILLSWTLDWIFNRTKQ